MNNKHESAPNQNAVPDAPDATRSTRANNPTQGEAAHRQKRPRAPQFGSDRRNPRDMDARRPKSARHHGDPNGLPQNSGDGSQPAERRKATQDRRQSYS